MAEKGHSIAIYAQWNFAMEQCCNGSLQWKFVMRSIMRTCTHNNYAKSRTLEIISHPEASSYTYHFTKLPSVYRTFLVLFSARTYNIMYIPYNYFCRARDISTVSLFVVHVTIIVHVR